MEDAIKVVSTKFDLSAEVLNNISTENESIGSWMTVLGAYVLDNDKKQEEQKSNENLLRKQRLNAGKLFWFKSCIVLLPCACIYNL